MTLKNSIIISGIGCLTPFGRGVNQVWGKIIKGQHCFTTIPPSPMGSRGHRLYGRISDKDINSLLPSRKFLRLPRYSKLVLSTAADCLRDSGIEPISKNIDPSRIGVFLGTSRGPQEAVESISLELLKGRPQQVNPLHFQETVYNAPLGHLSIHYGITGMCVAFCNGFASGLQALDVAVTLLDEKKIDFALVGAVDTLTMSYLRGLADVNYLSPQRGRCEEIAPFAEARNGSIIGEGGAFVALEREESNKARSGPAHSQLVSTGMASDGFSHYRNEPQGKGFEYAIQRCLDRGDLTCKDVNLIIACATGQREIDCAEWRGIASVWKKEVSSVPVTSVKGIMGDLGAATQIFALCLCSKIFEKQWIPGTSHMGTIDPDCPLKVIQRSVQEEVSTVLINEASWGGINASVILKKIELEQ